MQLFWGFNQIDQHLLPDSFHTREGGGGSSGY